MIEMLSLIPTSPLAAQHIALLRKLSGRSIAEIREAAAIGASVLDIDIFGSAWQEDRLLLRDLSRLYSAASPGFILREADEAGQDETLSAEMLKDRLQFWRGIELEQQRQSDLQMGYIESEDAFEPHDEDWTIA